MPVICMSSHKMNNIKIFRRYNLHCLVQKWKYLLIVTLYSISRINRCKTIIAATLCVNAPKIHSPYTFLI